MSEAILTAPPEVLARRLRTVLRQEREAHGITQKAAAERVLWSISKLIRIENGVLPIAPADVRVLLLEYGSSEERLSEMVEVAKAARVPSEWEAYRAVYPIAALNMFANEQAAANVQAYEPSIFPHFLQTEDYTRALLRETGSDPSLIDNRLRAIRQRQEVLDSPDCPAFDFVVGEAAVSRPIGGARVMLRQIEKLKSLAGHHPKVSLRLLPFAAGAHRGMDRYFTILEFADSDLSDLVYVDDEYRSYPDHEEVRRYTELFANICQLTVPPEQFSVVLDQISDYRFKNL